MTKTISTVALALLLAGAAQAAPSGAIKVCRQPGIVGLHQQDTISIPQGSLVRDGGPVEGKQTGYDRNSRDPTTWRHVRLETTAPAVLEKGKPCVTVEASVKEDKDGSPILASDRRLYIPVGAGKDSWALLAVYQISVVGDFR